jgi:signal transduction histidine kinase
MNTPALTRRDALEQLELREGVREAAFDRLARMAATGTGLPMAAIVLAGRDGPVLKACHGFEPQAPVDALLGFPALNSGRMIELCDVLEAGHLRGNALVMGDAAVRFYAGHPVMLGGVAAGTLCVLDRAMRTLDVHQNQFIKDVCALIADLLHSRERQRVERLERRGAQEVARVSGDWVWETDADHRYTWFSDNFEEHGARRQQYLGRLVTELPLVDRLGRPAVPASTLRSLFRTQQSFSRVVLRVDGRHGPRYISYSGVPRFDDEGDFTGFHGTGRDVSHRVRAEQRAHQKSLILRKLADQVPGMLFEVVRTADGHLSLPYASPGIRSVLELRASDLVRDASRLFDRVHPEDRPAVLESLDHSRRTQAPWRAEFRVVLPKGGVRWVEGRAGVEKLPDGSTLWDGFGTDITERRMAQSELFAALARWELAAEVAGIGIVDVDMGAQLVQLDPRAARMHGLSDGACRIALDAWLDTITPADRASMNEALGDVAHTGVGAVVRYQTLAHGPALTLETALRGAGEGPSRIIGTCHDATQRQRLEEAEREKLAAQKANESKSQFLSRVSHELRTPLNAILGFGQLLRRDASAATRPAADRERLEAIHAAGERLLALINDMLDLAQIEQGRLQLKPREIDVRAAVESACVMMSPAAAERAVTIANHVPPGQVAVRADERALGQVLLNVLSNAVKYNHAGGSVTVQAQAGDALISVTDTGPGLTPQQMQSLFVPFNRLGAERTATVGSGLGLVIAKALVDAMDGQLDVRSEVNVGTTVEIRLPAAQHVPQPVEPAVIALDAAEEEVLPEARARTVVYVEDDPVNLVLARHLFADEPAWRLVTASTTQDGLEAAMRERPDLVVTDMNLPDGNGLELLRRLRADERTAGTPCVVLSGDAMAPQVAAALDAGFLDYWTKPVDVKALHRKLRHLLA